MHWLRKMFHSHKFSYWERKCQWPGEEWIERRCTVKGCDHVEQITVARDNHVE